MRLNDFIFSIQHQQRLVESARDRYAEMFNFLNRLEPEQGEPESISNLIRTGRNLVEKQIDWTITTLKKPPIIVWYLKYVRVQALNMIAYHAFATLGSQPYMERTGLSRLAHSMMERDIPEAKLMKLENHDVESLCARFENAAPHYFGQTQIETIQNYDPSGKTMQMVFSDLAALEKAYQEKFGNTIPDDPDDPAPPTALIRFPDGSAWFNLNRNFCTKEARAMGHCGNEGNSRITDRILSLRSPVRGPKGQTLWSPHLTFVLNINTGMLGEMKGRGNAKPVARYHPQIIALLKLPLIQGIVGGGYMPENNFSLNDLPQGIAEELARAKPGLADLRTLYRIEGKRITPEVLKKLMALFSDSIWDVAWLPEQKAFILKVYSSVDQALQVLFGDARIDYGLDLLSSEPNRMGMSVDYRRMFGIFRNLPIGLNEAIIRYMAVQYPKYYANHKPEFGYLSTTGRFEYLFNISDPIIADLTRAIHGSFRPERKARVKQEIVSYLSDFDASGRFSIIPSGDQAVDLICKDPEWVIENANGIVKNRNFVDMFFDYKEIPEQMRLYDQKNAIRLAESSIRARLHKYIQGPQQRETT